MQKIKQLNFLDDDKRLSNKNLEYPSTISLNNNIVKRLEFKYPDSRKCNSCGLATGWHVVERERKSHIAANIHCNHCGKVNGFLSPTQWLRLQIVSTRLDGEVA
jgi:hypothetical protein